LVHSHALRSRTIRHYTFDDDDAFEDFLMPQSVEAACEYQEGVPDHIAKPIVHVVYDGRMKKAYERLQKAFHHRVHLFAVPVTPKTEAIIIDREARKSRTLLGLEGVLDLVTGDNVELHSAAVRLLNAVDPAAELQDMKQEFIRAYQRQTAFGGPGNAPGVHRAGGRVCKAGGT